MLLFLGDADHARYGQAVDRSLRDALPARFAGYPTQFSLSTLRAYLQEHLDLDVDVVFTLFHAVETKPPPFGSIVNTTGDGGNGSDPPSSSRMHLPPARPSES